MLRAVAFIIFVASPVAADVTAVVQDHVLPGYAAFDRAAKGLAAMDTCDIEKLRPAYQGVFDAWMAVAHLHLGPSEEKGRGLAIAFWPDPKGQGAKAQRALMLGDPSVLDPVNFADQSVAARGLMGLERLLYPQQPLPVDPCPLIRATSGDLSRMAAEIDQGWVDFGQTLITAGQPGNVTYLTAPEANQELLTQLLGGLEFLADDRLGRPLGSFDKPFPMRAEARASGRSLRNVRLSLAALRAMAVALVGGIPQTLAAFDRADALAAKLDDPVLAGVADPKGRLRIEILQQAIWATRDAVLAELVPALGVDRGFNAEDGD